MLTALGIVWLLCLAAFLECARRAPEIPPDEEL